MSTTDDLLAAAESIVRPWAIEIDYPEPGRMDVQVRAADFKLVIGELVAEKWGYLAAITGLDVPPPPGSGSEGQVEGLYHFCEGAAVTTVRVRLPYSIPVLDSICDLIPAATLYEREFIELFGVSLTGTPSTERLVLPDDWPGGVYPLRKSLNFGETPAEKA